MIALEEMFLDSVVSITFRRLSSILGKHDGIESLDFLDDNIFLADAAFSILISAARNSFFLCDGD